MQSIHFDIEKLGLSSKAAAPSTGAGGFDLILGKAQEDLEPPAAYDRPDYDRPQHRDRFESAEKADALQKRDRPLDEGRDEFRDERPQSTAQSDDAERSHTDRVDSTPKEVAERPDREEPKDSSVEGTAKTDQVAEEKDGEAPVDDTEAAAGETAKSSSPESADTAVPDAPNPDIDAAIVVGNGPAAVANAQNLGAPVGDPAQKAAAAALENAAANAALHRNPRQDAPAQSNRDAGGALASDSKPSTTMAQGQGGNGPAPASGSQKSDVPGLEVSVQKTPVTSGPVQMSSATALGVLQEQAASEAQKAAQKTDGESKAPLNTAALQKGSTAAALASINGQQGQQGSGLDQQRSSGTGQLPNAQTAGGQSSPAPGATFAQSAAGHALPPTTGAETAPSVTPSGQPLPVAAGNPTGLMQAAIQAAAPEHVRQAAGPQGPAEQVSVQIQTAVKAGTDRITIQLNPAELGKIDVKIELSDDGQLRAVISAERQETLELLQKDARGLEKSLQDAGLKTDMNSLAFQKGGDGRGHGPDSQSAGRSNSDPMAAQETAEFAQSRTSLHDGSLDISV